jgi:hypothetical protein
MAKERPRVWACFNDALVKLAMHVADSIAPAAPAAPAVPAPAAAGSGPPDG